MVLIFVTGGSGQYCWARGFLSNSPCNAYHRRCYNKFQPFWCTYKFYWRPTFI